MVAGLSPLGASDLVTSVISAVTRLIGSGVLKPNQRLIEAELGAALGVSRVPVREAIRILVGEGVLELRPKGGAWVKEIKHRDVYDMLLVLRGLGRLSVDLIFSNPHATSTATILKQSRILRSSLQENDAVAAMHSAERFWISLAQLTQSSLLPGMVARLHIGQYGRYITELKDLSVVRSWVLDLDLMTSHLVEKKAGRAAELLEQAFRHFELDTLSQRFAPT